jgi:hypothetical protein
MDFISFFVCSVLEQYSLSHEFRFQYINHAEAIKVPKIDDVKEMRNTQVCRLYD